MGEKPLSMLYPVLYELAIHKDASVFDVYSSGWVIQFSVRLPPLIIARWYDLAIQLNNVQRSDEKDIVIWKWTYNKIFSVKSDSQKMMKGQHIRISGKQRYLEK
jgi:hypothetical protein